MPRLWRRLFLNFTAGGGGGGGGEGWGRRGRVWAGGQGSAGKLLKVLVRCSLDGKGAERTRGRDLGTLRVVEGHSAGRVAALSGLYGEIGTRAELLASLCAVFMGNALLIVSLYTPNLSGGCCRLCSSD